MEEISKKEIMFYDLKYFWEEKGSIERYCSFNEAIEKFPLLKKAWDDYKLSIEMINCIFERGYNA